jgi:hypothetical protein
VPIVSAVEADRVPKFDPLEEHRWRDVNEWRYKSDRCDP